MYVFQARSMYTRGATHSFIGCDHHLKGGCHCGDTMILKETALLFISYILAAYLDLSASLSSTASYTPVLAPLGTAALKLPLCVSTSHSTVGLPLESKICLAVTFVISAGVIFLKYSAMNASGLSARAFTVALITSSTFFDNACESMYSYHHYQKHHHHITNTHAHAHTNSSSALSSAQLFFCFFLSLTCTHSQSSSREERHTCTAYTLIHLPSRHVYVLLQVQLHLSLCVAADAQINIFSLSLLHTQEIFFATPPTTQHTHKEEVSVVYCVPVLQTYFRSSNEYPHKRRTRAGSTHTHTLSEREIGTAHTKSLPLRSRSTGMARVFLRVTYSKSSNTKRRYSKSSNTKSEELLKIQKHKEELFKIQQHKER